MEQPQGNLESLGTESLIRLYRTGRYIALAGSEREVLDAIWQHLFTPDSEIDRAVIIMYDRLHEPETAWALATLDRRGTDAVPFGYIYDLRNYQMLRLPSEGQTLIIEDVHRSDRLDPYSYELFVNWLQITSLLAAPMKVPGGVLGYVIVESFAEHHFTPNEVLVYETIASHTGETLTRLHTVRELELFSHLVAGVNDGVLVAGLNHEIRYANPAGQRMFGLPSSQPAPPVRINQVLEPIDHSGAAGLEQLGQVPAWSGEVRALLPGLHTLAEANLSVVHNTAGQLVAIAGVFRDITARIRTERALQRRNYDLEIQGKLAAVLNKADDVEGIGNAVLEALAKVLPVDLLLLWVYDRNNQFPPVVIQHEPKVQSVEPAALASFARLAQEVAALARPLSIPDLHRNDKPPELVLTGRWGAFLGVPLISRERVVGVLELVRLKPGSFRRQDLRLLDILTQQITASLANAQSYVELQRHASDLEQEVQHRTAELLQTERYATSGRIAASLAHEISNPLQSLAGCLALLEASGGKPPSGEQYLALAKEEIERIAGLVQQLREFYRPAIDAWEMLDLLPILQEVCALVQARTVGTAVRLDPQWSCNLPATLGVRDHLKQVFLNLMLNAVEAMPQGGILTVSCEKDQQGCGLMVRVSDTGNGIPDPLLEQIFEPGISQKVGGAGLGLYISRTLVERHGGTITVKSRVGQGSTFTVTLPAQTPWVTA